MKNQLLIFGMNEYLTAIDIYCSDKSVIGFDGRDKLAYTGINTAQNFEQHILDYYNIERLSELDREIILIDCGIDEMIAKGFNTPKMLQDIFVRRIMATLEVDEKLMIKQYGLNFNGVYYFYSEGKLMKKAFNLLGYTVSIQDAINYYKG